MRQYQVKLMIQWEIDKELLGKEGLKKTRWRLFSFRFMFLWFIFKKKQLLERGLKIMLIKIYCHKYNFIIVRILEHYNIQAQELSLIKAIIYSRKYTKLKGYFSECQQMEGAWQKKENITLSFKSKSWYFLLRNPLKTTESKLLYCQRLGTMYYASVDRKKGWQSMLRKCFHVKELKQYGR